MYWLIETGNEVEHEILTNEISHTSNLRWNTSKMAKSHKIHSQIMPLGYNVMHHKIWVIMKFH
jgi:hypothetical protein